MQTRAWNRSYSPRAASVPPEWIKNHADLRHIKRIATPMGGTRVTHYTRCPNASRTVSRLIGGFSVSRKSNTKRRR